MSQISRRTFFQLSGGSLLAFGAFPFWRPILAFEDESVGWVQFLELCKDLSAVQFEEDWDQGTYTQEIESLMARLDLDDEQLVRFGESYQNYSKSFPEIRRMHYETQFMVSLVEFEAGEVIPLHDHPDMTGVILCAEGRVQVDHYDKLPDMSDQDRPLLKEERSLEMKQGSTAALTVDQGNIHTLHALEFTRMIDVFTPPYNSDRIRRSRYYTIESEPYQDKPGVFEAVATRHMPR